MSSLHLPLKSRNKLSQAITLSLFLLLLLNPVSMRGYAAGHASINANPLISIDTIDPSIQVEARYFSTFNFIGRPIEGYKSNKCLLLKEVAAALHAVQNDLRKESLSLKIYDCYRPQKSVDHFMRWVADPNDKKMKKAFYPTLSKKVLRDDVYIAKRSSHSTGSAVDLTIVPLRSKPTQYPASDHLNNCTSEKRYRDNSLDMGSDFDCFHPNSHTHSKRISFQQRKHRLMLKQVMEKHGFTNYVKEWWHFNFKHVKNRKQFFNFDVE